MAALTKITIKDVAKAASVSVSTVSRVFNDYQDISEETRQKVFAAARQLGYVPNSAARQLSSKKKKNIALILNGINVSPGVAMPLEILSGVSDALDATDYEFVFYATNAKKQAQKSLAGFCAEHDISGLIIQGLRTSDPYYQEINNFPLPLVAIDLLLDDAGTATVSIDNEAAAKEVTERLKAAGYKNILFVNGTKNTVIAASREAGFRAIFPDGDVLYADFSKEEAYRQIKNLSALTSYDAIFSASDLMAIGILSALTERQLNKKIAVVGFDDITLAQYTTPSLTTVRQDIQAISEASVTDLLVQIDTGEKRKHYIPYEIVVRESALI